MPAPIALPAVALPLLLDLVSEREADCFESGLAGVAADDEDADAAASALAACFHNTLSVSHTSQDPTYSLLLLQLLLLQLLLLLLLLLLLQLLLLLLLLLLQ